MDEFDSKNLKDQVAEYDILDATTTVAGNVMVSCFFGSTLKNEKIEGKSVPEFIKELIGDLAIQMFSPLTFLLGHRLIDLGLRKKDREIKRKAKIFKSWGKGMVSTMSREIKRKHENGELTENPKDLIDAIVRDSLKAEG